MPTLNLNNINKLFYSNTEAQKLYKGGDLLYSIAVVDPHLANVVLHLKGDGANDSTNIVDSSPTSKTITRFGDTKISTAQSKYGGSSIYFDGTGDYLTLPSDSDLIFATSSTFTVEFWVKLNATNLAYTVLKLSTNGGFRVGSGLIQMYDANSSLNRSSSYTANLNWTHVAYVRISNVINMYVNGILLTSSVANFGANSAFTVSSIGGLPFTGANYLAGYLDSLRITKNIARYTANFNPETDTYLAY